MILHFFLVLFFCIILVFFLIFPTEKKIIQNELKRGVGQNLEKHKIGG